jgi:DNA-binding transcriptional regulator GbsR (MarR family)
MYLHKIKENISNLEKVVKESPSLKGDGKIQKDFAALLKQIENFSQKIDDFHQEIKNFNPQKK